MNAKGLKIVYWNAQSQVHKYYYISNLLQENNIDVLVILESWLRADIEDKFIKVNNYSLCRQDRATLTPYTVPKRGGVICMYLKNTIPYPELCRHLYKLNSDNIELMTIRLHCEKLRPIFICAIYRPPTGNTSNFNEHIVKLMDNIAPSRKYDVYIGGDFNIEYSKPSPHRKYLKDFENRFSLTQLIYNKTRPLHSNAIVDLIFKNNPSDSTSGTFDINISDHLPIWVVRKKVKVKPVTTEFTSRT